MDAEPSLDLAAELRLLGQVVTSRAPESVSMHDAALVDAVMTRLAEYPRAAGGLAHRRGWRQAWSAAVEGVARRRRRVLIALAVVLLSLSGVPAVRAAVVDFFTFDGVTVQIRPSPAPQGTPSPPPAAVGSTSLREAATLVAFRPMVPSALGAPDGVEVSADRRVLSLTWDDARAGTLRLDEFDGTLDYAFAKTAPDAEWLVVNGQSALWFDKPHEVSVLDAAGQPRTESPRLAGHTLIWEAEGTVLRLEGDVSRERAVELATSAEPLT